MDRERLEPVLRLLDDAPFHRSRPSRLAWGVVGLVLLTAIVYVRAVLTHELFWQDRPALNGVASLFTLAHLWTHASVAYRPLALTLLWVERRGFGELPVPYHGVAVLAHALNCVLLWLILRRLAIPGAWLAAALFAVHPVQVQSVAWTAQQPSLISTLCFLLAVWLYLRWSQISPPLPETLAGLEPEEPPSRAAYVAALAASIVAVLSGPLGVSVPVALLLLTWWKRGSVTRSAWARLAPFFAVALVGIAANVVLHRDSADPLGVAPVLTLLQRVMIAGRAIGFYAMNLLRLWPAELIHPRWDPAQLVWNAAPGLLIVGSALIAWLGRRWWGIGPLVCILLFVSLLLPNVLTVLSQPAPAIYVADPHQYLASAVPLALLAAGLMALCARLATSMPLRTARAGVGVIAIGLLAAFAFVQNATYRSSESALKTAVSREPTNVVARAQYALLLLDRDPSEAMKVLDEAGPDAAADLTLLDARGRVCMVQGRYDDAIASYLSAQRLSPEHPAIPLALAAAYEASGSAAVAQGRPHEAFDSFNDALAACETARQLDPANPLVDVRIGTVLLHEGRIDDSIHRFDAAATRDSACAAAHVHKAQALFEAATQGDSADQVTAAYGELQEAFRIDPANADAFCALANMQFRAKRFAAAEVGYRSAIQINPGSAEAWTDLGFAQSAQNRYRDAIRSFERALSLRADAPDALRGKRLAQVQLATGNQKS